MKETLRSSDGSVNYGNGVWGPSTVDLQRANLIFANEKPKTKEESSPHLLFVSRESVVGRLLQVMSKVKLPARFAIPGSMATVFLMSACGGVGEKNTQELENKESSGYELPFPKGETWYLTGGPHADGFSNGVRYAIDIAPPEVAKCPTDGSRLVIDNRVVTASASGQVIVAGDDKNRSDPSHSMVKIKDAKGLTEVYIHLANTKVKKGDKVSQGAPLGNPSCEYPPGGRNEGPHIHVGLEKDGQALPIDGVVVGGWTIRNLQENYDGTMTKSGEKTRTADTRRCPDDKACGGIRNDLTNNGQSSTVVAEPKSPIPPISGQVNEEKAERQLEKGWTRFKSSNLPYQIDYPSNWKQEVKNSESHFIGKEINGHPTQIIIRVEPTGGLTLDELIETRIKDIELGWKRVGLELQITKTPNQSIDGLRAWRTDSTLPKERTSSGTSVHYTYFLAEKNGKLWSIEFSADAAAFLEESPILLKTIDSFKFLDNPQVKPTETPKPTPQLKDWLKPWQQVSSKDLKYAALFPSNFTRQTVKQDGEKVDVIEGKYEGLNARFLIMSFDIGLENPAELLQLQSAILLNTGLGQMMGTFPDTRTLDSIPINIGGKIQGEAEVILIMDRNGKPELTLIDTLVFTQKRSWLLAMTTDATETSAREKMQNLFQRTAKTFSIK